MKKHALFIILAMLCTGLVVMAQDDTPINIAPEPISDSVAVTVYNQGSSLIQDRRTLNLEPGLNQVDFVNVASSIDSTSVNFSSITDPSGTYVLEQNYVYDLVNREALLQRYLDERIVVTTLLDGAVYEGRLLSGRGGEVIIQTDDGGVVALSLGSVRDLRFPQLPDGLITRPTLRWLVNSSESGAQEVELTYLTGGISWTADYNVLLNTDNTGLDLNGWVTLTNTSGASYTDAQLKLVAGDVNRIMPEEAVMRFESQAMDMVAPSAAPAVEQREFFEYQLYEVARPVTISDNETKQVEFVTGANITATTYYVYNATAGYFNYGSPIADQYYGQTGITDVQNYLEFSTDEESGLGADLPAGRVRVYQEDTDGAALLIGENRIDHTPEGEMVSLYLGNAFDLVGERTQTNFQLVSRNVLQETYEIRLRNRKDDDTVEIRVPENLFRWSNWEILNTTHEFTQVNSNTIEFRVDVPPGEEIVITYTVQYAFPNN
ncbi:MAG: DUF4139 domain-containing protein [Aggregatilineales bacterium]